MQKFIKDNWVFLSGLISAIVLVLQQFIGVPVMQWSVVGIAVGLAVLGYIANEWRGKGMTWFGIIGTLAYTFIQVYQNGQINWNQFIIMAVVALLSAVAPPPKNARYEQSPPIANAKRP